MASSSSRPLRLNPRNCFCGRTATMQICRSNENGNQGRVYSVCPSRYDKRARQSCKYFQWMDEEDENVTSMDCSIRTATVKEVEDIKKKLNIVDKLVKLALVLAIVSIVKWYL